MEIPKNVSLHHLELILKILYIKESASQMGYSVIQYGHGQILAWAAVIYNKKENSLPAKHNNFLEIFHVIGVFFLIGIAGLGS